MLVFVCSTWHTAMDNTTPRPRESLIIMFSPFWRKGGLEASGRRVEAKLGKKLEPMLRQMVGLEMANGGGNIYDPEHMRRNPRPDLV